jgi:hypothetical protein
MKGKERMGLEENASVHEMWVSLCGVLACIGMHAGMWRE